MSPSLFRPDRSLLLLVLRGAALGVLAGAAVGGVEASRQRFLRILEAGEGSSLGDRLLLVAHHVLIEGAAALLMGVALVALLAILRLAWRRSELRQRPDPLQWLSAWRLPTAVARLAMLLALSSLLLVAGSRLVGGPLAGPASESGNGSAPALSSAERPNVLFVVVDTLRADHLGCYGYELDTSPFLDGLAAEGARFEDPVAPASWTKPSVGTLFTGLHPSRHGARHHGSRLVLPPGGETLSEVFAEHGYETAAFVANPNLARDFAFDHGFEHYVDSPGTETLAQAALRRSITGRLLQRLTRHPLHWTTRTDVEDLNRLALSWLDETRDRPFFLYLHYIDPHAPYDPPAPYRRLFEESAESRTMALYDGEIRHLDDGLAELAARLAERGLWRETLVVVTADHGEELGEHGTVGHGQSLFQAVIRVPLLLRGPGVPRGAVIEEPVQLLDLPATLLELVGLSDTGLGDGRSFAGLLRPPAAPKAGAEPDSFYLESELGSVGGEGPSFAFVGLRRGRYKLVLGGQREAGAGPSVSGEIALYDLVADPGETTDLASSPEHRRLLEELLRELRRTRQEIARRGVAAEELVEVDPDSDLAARLRALGYL